MAKIGRNDPCHCGKGKKYKVCCGRDQRDDKARRYEELRRAESGLIRSLFGLADSLLGEKTKDAWYEWLLSTRAVSRHDEEMMVFGPWYLYCWQPDALKKQGPTIAAACLQLMGPRLSSDEKMIIQSLNLQPFSFWDVIDVRPGQGFRVRDIFRGFELDIEERKASAGIQVNAIVFGIFVQLDGIGFAMGMAPFSIPPIEKGAIVKLRYELREKHGVEISSDILLTEQKPLRELFFTIRDRLFNPAMPQLCNTDGDPFVPHKIKYGIDDPHESFHALKPLLTQVLGEDEARFGIESESNGRITKATLRWVRKGFKNGPGEATTLALMHIDGKSLIVETNSVNRTQKVKNEISKYLASATHIATVVEPMDRALEEAWRNRGKVQPENSNGESCLESPEAIAAMRELMDKQAKAWLGRKLPALGGLTPRQAVRDPDGREMVESLLADFDRKCTNTPAYKGMDVA